MSLPKSNIINKNLNDKTKQSTTIPSTRNRNSTLSNQTQSTPSSDIFNSSLNTDENNFIPQKSKPKAHSFFTKAERLD